jgi:pimeloyl-ACP methyl ester carboxylesterase
VAVVTAALVLAAFMVFHRHVVGKIAFDFWRMVSSAAHGGRYAQLNGVRLYYETYGSGPPVLVLSGGALEDMRNQILALAPTRFVIAVDLRGHGRSSDSDTPLSYVLMADDVLKLLDQLQIRRTDIVGWSDGGIIALDLVMHHPERVRRIVTIGANYDVDGLVEVPSMKAPDAAHWPERYRKVVAMWATQPRYSLAELAGISAPTLVMAGEFDIVKREHTIRLAHAIRGGEECIIDGATHGVIWEMPDIVDAEMLPFLNEALPQ